MTYNDVLINSKKITLPQRVRKFKRLPAPEKVIAAVKDTDIELPVLMGMWSGMRISEIPGVRKSDIDGNILTINQVIVYTGGKALVKKQLRLIASIVSFVFRPVYVI